MVSEQSLIKETYSFADVTELVFVSSPAAHIILLETASRTDPKSSSVGSDLFWIGTDSRVTALGCSTFFSVAFDFVGT